MSDIGSQLPVPIAQLRETKEMKLKWLQASKQERISKIVHLKQAIDERQIMAADQELKNLEAAERLVKESLDGSISSEVK